MKKIHINRRMSTGLFMTLILITLGQFGCKKPLAVDLPIDKNTAQTVYGSTSSAVAALDGIYIQLSQGGFVTGEFGVSVDAGLLADELTSNDLSIGIEILYTNAYLQDPTVFWAGMYGQNIFRVNSLIEGVSASKGIPEASKKILLGEAKTLRALAYFNLVNLYGDVPLVTTTDFKTNSNIPRSPKATVYEQIIKDLTEAQQGLTDQYLGANLASTTTERVRPNRAAATALLARVYLYLERWSDAEQEATKIIDNTGTYSLPALNDVFLANSPEAIWQLQTILNPNNEITITGDAQYFIPHTGDIPQVYISQYVLNAFEANDMRKNAWIRTVTSGTDEYPIPNKYKAGLDGFATDPEYNMIFRLGEQYLIRAEARAKLGKIMGANSAESDLNAIRTRAGLPGTTATDQTSMLDAIMRERQVELFTEWGHRWFDLKRTKTIDAVMPDVEKIKGGTWAPYKALLPIPGDEFLLNPALRGHQNPGYTEPTN